MKAYAFRAALYCEDCAQAIRRVTNKSLDSDVYPQGPYESGGGESDTPQHCDQCGVFLENPLTDDGRAYVVECLASQGDAAGYESEPAQEGDSAVVEEWRKFYGITDAEIWKASQ